MSAINQDLQASHELLTLLEQSKSTSENVLDHLSQIFAVVDPKGTIWRGNHELSQLLSCDLEQSLAQNLSKLFLKETWNLFLSRLKELLESTDLEKRVEFELPINSNINDERIYYWNLSRLNRKDKNVHLVCLIGQNITQLRAYEKQIAEVFASIPLGIITIGRSGKTEEQFSAYSTYLLSTQNIANRGLRELIFNHLPDSLSAKDTEGLGNLLNAVDMSELLFESVKETFPKQVHFKLDAEGAPDVGPKWLGLKFQPIIYEGIVKRLLVIIEDRTMIVEAQAEQAKLKILEDQQISRILQIKRADPDLLPIFMEEIEKLFAQLTVTIGEKDLRALANVLHGIKGNCRIAGFEVITQATHTMESSLLTDGGMNFLSSAEFHGFLNTIKVEWQELSSLYRALSSDKKEITIVEEAASNNITNQISPDILNNLKKQFDKFNQLLARGESNDADFLSAQIAVALKSINFKELKSLEKFILQMAKDTADQLKKIIDVECYFDSILVNDDILTILRESLMHIINNAVDHGIESPEARLEKGKRAAGKIIVSSRKELGRLVIQIIDDGAGINIARVKSLAFQKKLISQGQMNEMSDEEAMALIFKPNFSTAKNVTEISGRGVGLDSAREMITKRNGSVAISKNVPFGSIFTIELRMEEELPLNTKMIAVPDFLRYFHDRLVNMSGREGVEVSWEPIDTASFKGLLFADNQNLVLSLVSIIAENASRQPFKITISTSAEGFLQCKLKPNGVAGKLKPIPGFVLPKHVTEYYIKKHGGAIISDGIGINISIGKIIDARTFQNIYVVPSPGIKADSANSLFSRIKLYSETCGFSEKLVFSSAASPVPSDALYTIGIFEEVQKGSNGFDYCLDLNSSVAQIAEVLTGVIEKDFATYKE